MTTGFESFTGINKPKFGEPCNGCGLCCAVQLCLTAEYFFGDVSAPCPALELVDGIFRCGLVRRPSHYQDVRLPGADAVLSPMFAEAIGAGQGCGCPDEDAEPELDSMSPRQSDDLGAKA